MTISELRSTSAPHVYGGDPRRELLFDFADRVLPMYMGVILIFSPSSKSASCAPHVYGGDPISIPAYISG